MTALTIDQRIAGTMSLPGFWDGGYSTRVALHRQGSVSDHRAWHRNYGRDRGGTSSTAAAASYSGLSGLAPAWRPVRRPASGAAGGVMLSNRFGPMVLLAFAAGLFVGSWAALLVREFGVGP